MQTRVAMVINNRQKAPFVYKAVASALAQTYPCYVLISDQFSTDNSVEKIERAIAEAPRGADHEVHFTRSAIRGVYGMQSCNAHLREAWQKTPPDCEWIMQLSADDYSLPDRTRVCMEAVEKNPCSAIACTMYFEEPGTVNRSAISGYPRESGYVKPGEGLLNLAYGSVITGYAREFLERMDDGGPNTLDVYYGFLAALQKGFYVVANPQHVHVQHFGGDAQMGFQGKMRGVEGDDLLRLAELNHYQLLALYDACAVTAQKLFPEGINQDDWNALLSMIIGQGKGWLEARKVLHAKGIAPGVL